MSIAIDRMCSACGGSTSRLFAGGGDGTGWLTSYDVHHPLDYCEFSLDDLTLCSLRGQCDQQALCLLY